LRLGASRPILIRMEDRRNILFDEMPFSYKLVKDKKAIIYHKGKEVYTAVSKDYNKLQRVIAMDNAYELQLFLAKITGNFKRGNERG
jgi:hypothetical protein